MPNYDPDAAVSILQPGFYEAVVKSAENKRAKESGNEMIRLILTVYGPNNAQVDVFDYLVFHPQMLHRVRHFCESAGIDFEKGSLDASECERRNVRVKIKIEKSEGYADKNAVVDYLPRTGNGPTAVAVNREPEDSDIPF